MRIFMNVKQAPREKWLNDLFDFPIVQQLQTDDTSKIYCVNSNKKN